MSAKILEVIKNISALRCVLRFYHIEFFALRCVLRFYHIEFFALHCVLRKSQGTLFTFCSYGDCD